MARPKSWEQVAHTLASRLMHHAYCENGCEELRPDDCPFCGDIAAYRDYRAKCDATGRLPMKVSDWNNGPVISLEEVLRQGAGLPREDTTA